MTLEGSILYVSFYIYIGKSRHVPSRCLVSPIELKLDFRIYVPTSSKSSSLASIQFKVMTEKARALRICNAWSLPILTIICLFLNFVLDKLGWDIFTDFQSESESDDYFEICRIFLYLKIVYKFIDKKKIKKCFYICYKLFSFQWNFNFNY